MSGKIAKKIAAGSSIGAGIGILAASVLIVILALVLSIGNIPAMLISPATVFILAFGGFCGGFCSARLCKEKGFICGAISGLVFCAVLWLAGMFSGGGTVGTGMFIKATMIIISSSLGGIFGVNYIKRK